MGIRFACPNGHKLNVKEHLAGKRGICPNCGAKFTIPLPQPAPPSSASVGAGGRPSDEFGPPSGLIRISDPRPSAGDLEDIPDSVVVGIPARPAAAGPPAAPTTLPPRIALDLPAEMTGVVAPVEGPANTAAPSMEELFMPPVGDAILAPAAAETGFMDRRSGRRLQLLLAIVLLLAVIILACVLIWVLQREPQPQTASLHDPVRLAQSQPPTYIVGVDSELYVRSGSAP